MSTVRILTLGHLAVADDGQRVDWLASQRLRTACLVYLAVEREASRDRLMAVFWPDADGERARRSLNQVIYTIRRSLGDETVLTDGDRVRIGPAVEVDATEFVRAAESKELAAALALYGGTFLSDTSLAASPEFEQWVDRSRAQLERLHRRVARDTIDQLSSAGDLAGALHVAQQWCDVAADDDEAHHHAIALLIRLGQRAEAIRHFEAYREHLRASELEPMDETAALIAALRTAGSATWSPAGLPPSATPVLPPAVAPVLPEAVSDSVAPEQAPAGFAALVQELKRRRVVGALSVYAVVAWAVIQFATQVFPVLELPDWSPKLVVVLVLLGLPFALFFAWQYDITSRGLRRTASAAVEPSRRMPVLLPRWSAALLVLAISLYGGWKLYGRLRPTPARGTVAVFPFCATGTGFDAEYIADHLAHQVDAIPELQSADPNVLLPAAAAAKLNCHDAVAAGDIARRLGANRFMLGSIARAENEIRADATLYDASGSMKWAVTTSAPAGAWLQIVDSLMRKVVEKQGLSVGDRMTSLAASTTRSQAALLAYLEGERAWRATEWSRASDHYRHALQIDSTFALAWLRLALSLFQDLQPAPQRHLALTKARQFAAQLPEREQRLLYAMEARDRGAVAEAIERLRAYVGLYPDDREAWYELADLEDVAGGWLGHDKSEVLAAVRRAAELGHSTGVFGLAWTYWDLSDYARADSVTSIVLATAGSGEWVVGLAAARDFYSRDTARIRARIESDRSLPQRQRISEPPWALWVYNYDLWEQLAENLVSAPLTAGGRAEAAWRLVDTRYRRGKLEAARRELNRIAATDRERALAVRVTFALNPIIRSDLGELRRLRGTLDSLVSRSAAAEKDAGRAAPVAGNSAGVTLNAPVVSAAYYVPVRLYWAARISLALGDTATANQYAMRLERLPETEDVPTGNANLAAAIRAHIAAWRQDDAGALAALDRISFIIRPQVDVPKPFEHAPERALRAEILARQRRIADAARWYSRTDGDYEPYAMKRRGELEERLGHRAAAVEIYRHLRELLDQCDPPLRPLRDFAVRRLAALHA